MIDKVGDVYILTCDICGEEEDEDFGYFYDAVEYKSKMGWKSQRNSAGHWEDVCPECAGLNSGTLAVNKLTCERCEYFEPKESEGKRDGRNL